MTFWFSELRQSYEEKDVFPVLKQTTEKLKDSDSSKLTSDLTQSFREKHNYILKRYFLTGED